MTEPHPIDLTLDEIRSLSTEARAARFNALVGGGYHAVGGLIYGSGLHVTYRSQSRPAGLGVCEATEVTYSWAAETRLPSDGDSINPAPPPDFGNAPLRRNGQRENRVFHRLAGRRASSSLQRTEGGCAALDHHARFVSADSLDAYRRASTVLAALQRQLARRPRAIAIECGGLPDCVDRVRRTAINELESIGACRESWSAPARPNCIRYQFEGTIGATAARAEGFEVETTDGEGRPRIRRLRWHTMVMIS